MLSSFQTCIQNAWHSSLTPPKLINPECVLFQHEGKTKQNKTLHPALVTLLFRVVGLTVRKLTTGARSWSLRMKSSSSTSHVCKLPNPILITHHSKLPILRHKLKLVNWWVFLFDELFAQPQWHHKTNCFPPPHRVLLWYLLASKGSCGAYILSPGNRLGSVFE
jgi:hypothetical protein